MYNPDEESRLFTTTKDRYNTIAYFVFHVLGEAHGFYDWWATLTVEEQIKTRDKLVARITSVYHT